MGAAEDEEVTNASAGVSSSASEHEERRKKRRRDRVRLQEGSRIGEPGTDPETEPFAEGGRHNSSTGEKANMTMLGLSSAFDLVKKVSDKMSAKKQGKKLVENDAEKNPLVFNNFQSVASNFSSA